MDGLWAETRSPAANRSLRERRGSEGAVFFGYFLLGKQKKVTGRHGWRTKQHTDVSRLSRERGHAKSKVKMDSGLRRNDEGPSVDSDPAAGTTNNPKGQRASAGVSSGAIALAIASTTLMLPASRLPLSGIPSRPTKSQCLPPASRMSRQPAAMSHGFSPIS